MNWDLEGLDWPLIALALGLVVAAWVMRGSQVAGGWPRWAAAALGLGGVVLLGHQLYTQVSRPDAPTLEQCLVLMRAEPGEAPEAPADVAAPDTMGFVSGAVWGVYWRLAEDLVAVARTGGVRLTNVRTSGSVDNISRMKSTVNAALGIVQGDVPLTMKESTRNEDGMAQLGALMALHREPVQVLTRAQATNPAGGSLADLANQRVVYARDSEGAKLTAQYLLRRLGVSPQGGTVEGLPAERAVCDVVTGRAAAMFVVAGKPAPLLLRVGRLARHWPRALADLRFMPIQPNPGSSPLPDVYEAAQLDTSDYPWLPGTTPVRTVAMRAMLVSYDFGTNVSGAAAAKCKQVAQLVCTLRQDRLRLRQPPYDPAWREVGGMANDIPGTWAPSRCLPRKC